MRVNKMMTKEQAQDIYRNAWLAYQKTKNEKVRKSMEMVMSRVQSMCTTSGQPSDEWNQFAKTLPKYETFWNRLLNKMDYIVTNILPTGISYRIFRYIRGNKR